MSKENNSIARPYEASAIISIPFRFEKENRPKKKIRSKRNMWSLTSTNEISKDLGLLPHVQEVLNPNTSNSFDGNDIEIFSINGNGENIKRLLCDDIVTFESKKENDNDSFSFKFRFSLYEKSENSEEEKYKDLFWGEPRLVVYPLSHIGLLTLPIYHYDKNMDNIYEFFNKVNVSLAYGWKLKFKDGKHSLKDIFDLLTHDLDNVTPLCNKSLVSFIYAYNSELRNGKDDDFKKCSEKLTYTDNRKGFVTDDDETSFVQLLESIKLYSSAGPFGASFVTNDLQAFDRKSQDKYFWIYLLLIVQRYSLINMLYKLNSIFSEIANKKIKDDKHFKKLQENYQEMCEIKAGLYYTEISDQYHNMRLYHKFFEGFNINKLYGEVEEKLEALDKFVSIEKDKRNRFTQALITALVLVLTITSALNDFFDMMEDSFKIIPGIISMAIVVVVIVAFWPRIKEILQYGNK